MADSIIPFDFGGVAVRVMIIDGEPWFVAADVCRVLDIANPRDALSRLDADERGVGTTDTLGGPQEVNLVSEAGLYSLTFTSRKPEAKAFKRWVTREVIPSIRKTGSYGTAPDPVALLGDPAFLRTLLGSYAERVQALEATVAETQPKAEVYDRIVESGDTLGLREAHKVLRDATGITERELTAWMLRHGWAQRLGTRLAPASYGERTGYVTARLVEWSDATGAKHTRPEFRVTPKGVARLTASLTSGSAH